MNFITLLDYVGTFAFAISGIRLASAKHFDWFGAYAVSYTHLDVYKRQILYCL